LSDSEWPVPAELAPDPIIVYGAPRSGTTYLEQILNAHPAIFISHETLCSRGSTAPWT